MKNRNLVIGTTLSIIIWFVIVYLIGTAIMWNSNPSEWHISVRTLGVMLLIYGVVKIIEK